MCGIIGLLLADPTQHVNQMLIDGLTVLQHRGQDAAGIVTAECSRPHDGGSNNNARLGSTSTNSCSKKKQVWRLHLRKENGLVKDVFQQHHMTVLTGNMGVGHVRYPTAGSSSCAEAQPLYTNYPYGICVAHNGNLTNVEQLYDELDRRHVNTDSDSELLLNLFAKYLTETTTTSTITTTGSKNSRAKDDENVAEAVLTAMERVMTLCRGGYAGLYLINGFGLVGFRDPHGIRPLVFGTRPSTPEDPSSSTTTTTTTTTTAHTSAGTDYVFCSESVAIDTLGFNLARDLHAGEAIFIDTQGRCHTRICHPSPVLSPCIFEYVYFARPDSIIDGVSVYETRIRMGEKLAKNILRHYPDHDIDVVIPIPDTSRTAALQAAYTLNRPFREGFIKNRYIARTFIMPGQATRRKSVRLKLNTIKSEFAGKNVLLVDDSIVRGTTAHEIVQMARDAGAKKVFFTSAAPPIRYPNIYGIDIPTRSELIAFERNEAEIAQQIGCDWVLYQELKDLESSVREATPPGSLLRNFDTSCFSGTYVTGEQIGDDYFIKLHDLRNDDALEERNRYLSGRLVTPNKNALHPSNGDLPQTDLFGNGFQSRSDGSTNHQGCESVANETRRTTKSDGGCESLDNDTTKELE